MSVDHEYNPPICISCGKPITTYESSVHFYCPNCGEVQNVVLKVHDCDGRLYPCRYRILLISLGISPYLVQFYSSLTKYLSSSSVMILSSAGIIFISSGIRGKYYVTNIYNIFFLTALTISNAIRSPTLITRLYLAFEYCPPMPI